MLNFKALTEKEIDEMDLIPEGEYKFKIIEAIHEISRKSGHPQIKIRLRIFIPQLGERTLTDYLSTNGKFMMRKFRHFCESTEIFDKYEAGNISSDDCLDKIGLVKYNDKNTIIDYCKWNGAEKNPSLENISLNSTTSVNDFKDDQDIPF